MNTQEALTLFREKQLRINSYRLALTTMNWDSSTIAPKKGADYRNHMMAILSGELFSLYIDPEYIKLIEQLAAADDLSETESIEMKQMLKELNKERNIPKDVFVKFAQLQRDGETIWEKAKETSDYPLFKPYLQKLIDGTKRNISYRNDTRSTYASLIDDFETDMTIEKYDEFFALVKEKLVPLIHAIKEANIPAPAFLSASVPIQQQRAVVELIREYLQYPKDAGLISESVHPFSSSFSAFDNRVTVRYHENNFTSSIFALIHEVGHATYNGQVNPEYQGRHIANSMTYGMHESQSRLYENMLGRSKAFWSSLYPKVVELVDALKDVSLDEFIFGINYVTAQFYRIEADELTYPLHVLVRYEIEKDLFEGNLTTEGLDEVWADKYESYLDIRPQSTSEGILQDVHWSGGAFGYFPTYALGSAYSAQFMNKMSQDLDIDKLMENNQFDQINGWLKDNIHTFGGLYTPEQLLLRITGETFNPSYYIDYLLNKYSELYKIKL